MVRLRLITPGLPLRWFGSSLAVVVVAHLIESLTTGPTSGATGHPALYRTTLLGALAVSAQYGAVVRGFLAFALGLGLTRRDFFAGTSLIALVEAAGCGIALTALQTIERAAGAPLVGLPLDGVPAQFLGYVGCYLLAACTGLLIGAAIPRWGVVNSFLVTLGSALLLAQPYLMAVSVVEDQAVVDRWLTVAPQAYVLLNVAPPLVAIGLAVASYLILRRSDV